MASATVDEAQPSRSLARIPLLVLALLGAAAAWKPADSFYTQDRQSFRGQAYFAKVDNPNLADEEYQQLKVNAKHTRYAFAGVFTAFWGLVVGGVVGGYSAFAARGGVARALGGAMAGVAIGLAYGFVGGLIGQWVAETIPVTRLDDDTRQMLKAGLYHGTAYAVFGLGIGLILWLCARTQPFARCILFGLLAGAAGGLVYTPIASVLFPLSDSSLLVPTGSYARLAWFLTPAAMLAILLPLGPHRTAKAS